MCWPRRPRACVYCLMASHRLRTIAYRVPREHLGNEASNRINNGAIHRRMGRAFTPTPRRSPPRTTRSSRLFAMEERTCATPRRRDCSSRFSPSFNPRTFRFYLRDGWYPTIHREVSFRKWLIQSSQTEFNGWNSQTASELTTAWKEITDRLSAWSTCACVGCVWPGCIPSAYGPVVVYVNMLATSHVIRCTSRGHLRHNSHRVYKSIGIS